jgi:hypothetical protein
MQVKLRMVGLLRLRFPAIFPYGWMRFMFSHPFARKKAKGWGTGLLCWVSVNKQTGECFWLSTRFSGGIIHEYS